MPYPPLTNAQLRSKMNKYLTQFNDEGVTITDQTKHNEVLASDDGPNAQMSSQFVYNGMVRWKLTQHDQDTARWPANWMANSVEELAAVLIPT